MATSHHESVPNKRKAKKAELAAKRQAWEDRKPLESSTYQSSVWAPKVYETEKAVHETIVMSKQRLTNAVVKKAFITLIERLRSGTSPTLEKDERDVSYSADTELEYLIWNIRRHWTILFREKGSVHTDDLVGILRTLLHSIEAHAWKTSPELGYVAFLYDFLNRVG